MFGSSNKQKRPSEIAAGQRTQLLPAWPGTADDISGWTARDIYLVQDALAADPGSYQAKKFGRVSAMTYLMGRRAALTGISLKLPPFQFLNTNLSLNEWMYLTGFLDALADKAFGTDRVPPEIKDLYPDYKSVDVGS